MRFLSLIWTWFSTLITRRVLARLLSTFLCTIVVVIRPWSRLGGRLAFLVLTLKELVFAVQDNLAQHVEACVLNITGALWAIAMSSFARYLSSRCPDQSVSSRTIPAVFLVLVVCIAGWAKSRLPRLQSSTRITCFVTIFILTTDVGESSLKFENSPHFVWITLSAVIICLFSSLLLLRWTSNHFAEHLARTFAMLHTCLAMSLEDALDSGRPVDRLPTETAANFKALMTSLLPQSVLLNTAYAQAAFELRVGRLSVQSLKPLIGIVEHIRRELSWGRSPAEYHHDSKHLESFRKPTLELGHAILTTMKAIEMSISELFCGNAEALPHTPHDLISRAQEELHHARNAAREELRSIFDALDIEQRAGNSKFWLSRELSDPCLLMISLLQMAHEMHSALTVLNMIILTHRTSTTRLWHPRFSLAWLGLALPTVIVDDRAATNDVPELFESESHISMAEVRQGLAERKEVQVDAQTLASDKEKVKEYSVVHRSVLYVRPRWNGRRVLRARLALATVLRSIVHSTHLKHAIKNGIGVGLLCLPAFLPAGSSGQKWFSYAHGQWAAVSYVWVLETNLGATWRMGYLRISGTILGATYSYITWLICRRNPYGLVAMVTAFDIPMSWIIINSKVSSLGVVASVTLPPIVLSQYVNESEDTSVNILAVYRAALISAGVIAALLVNAFVFPRHCRVLFLRGTSHTLGMLSQLYLALGRELFQKGHPSTSSDRHKTLHLELEIRSSLYRLTQLIQTMQDEISILPKPMRQYRNTVAALQHILDIMTGIRKVRENIPIQETVLSVFRERREFVSCVCISLYASEHAFRVRQPLPQFLPSARHALQRLVTQMEDSIRAARAQDPHAMGLSLVYAFAESELLKDMVDTLEGLLNICRTLFGAATWLEERHWSEVTVIEENVHHGWYSTL
ncbi:hypothetical protein FA95DRAFT_1493111 [Auriscalpium vulgare]|uniref:Uncharacterized protein n=1 Tax=Auriscalpium vulgare TaxID=40419 RepID=A0ACB8RSS1_9AGAM|nr:hypothetical protein FA95DRAFT_1493111 [Auriscalpium vulgare]